MKKTILALMLFGLMISTAFALNYTIELSDSYGDGWGWGASITVNVNGVPVLTDITLSSGSGPESFSFTVTGEDEITTNYTPPSSYAYENSYQIKNEIGVVVAESGQAGTEPENVEYTVPALIPGTPDAPLLVSPANGATNVAIDTNLEWTIDENTDHAVLYLADNAEFTDANVINPATSPYTTSLTSGTTYFWKVVAVGPTAIEVASNVNSFTTPFNAISEFPYEQGFEMWPPAGWVLNPESGTGAWLQDDGTDHGPGVDNIYADDYAAMFNNYDYSNGTIGSMETPELDLSSMTAPLVKFYWWNNDGSSSPAQLKVYTKELEGEWTLVENIEVYGSGTTSWVESSNLIATDVRFVKIEAVSDYGLKNTYVDGFVIEEAPTNPIVEITTDPIAFGTYSLNESSDEEYVSIQNIGGGTLNITDVSITGTDADQFAYIDSEDYALAATEELLIGVTFTPTSAGEKTATLQITDDLAREVYEIALSGTGLDTNIYEINIPYSQDFETEEGFVGWTSNITSTSSSATAGRYSSSSNAHGGTYSYRIYHPYVYNPATTAELISPVVIPDMDAYRIRFWSKKTSSSNSDPLVVGKYNQAMDSFTAIDTIALTTTYAEYSVAMEVPVRANERIAFQYSTDASYSSNSVYIDDLTLEAIPQGSLVQITPESYDFEEVFIGYESSQTFTVANNGVIAANIAEITSLAGYTTETEVTFPYTLEVGASFTIDVTFAPEQAMDYDGNLTLVESMGTGRPKEHNITLSGTGIPVPQGANCSNPLLLTFPAVDVTGNTADFIDDYSSSWITPSSSYMNGDDVVYQFTLANTMMLNGSITPAIIGDDIGAFILEDEPNATTPAAVVLSKNSMTAALTFTNEMIPAGTYYLIISSYPSPQSFEYTINLTADPLPVPVAATSPSPADEAIDQPTALTLTWNNADYTETVDLWFGPTPAPTNSRSLMATRNMVKVLDNVAAIEEYAVTDLDPNTEYSWKVVCKNYAGETADTLVATWTFTTIGNAPEAVTYTAPADEATDVALSGSLTWQAGTGANGYYVYLSTDDTFTGVSPIDQVANYYDFSDLDYSTTYYWKVIPYNVVGQPTEGILVWSFTTIPDPTISTFPWTETFTTWPAENWSQFSGILAETTPIATGSSWSHDEFANIGSTTNSARLNIYGTKNHWLVTPPINLDANVESLQLDFDIALTTFTGNNATALSTNDYVAVVISTDNGVTWSNLNVLQDWSYGDEISHTGDNYAISLEGYSGIVKFGFYAERPSGYVPDINVYFDNITVREIPTAPIAQLSATEIDFGSLNIGETGTDNVTISNIGVGTLNISTIEIVGDNADDFAYSTDPEASMALGEDESLVISLDFTPSAEGAREATLQITDDLNRTFRVNTAAKNTSNNRGVNEVALSGNAVDPVIRTLPFTEGFEEGNTHNSTNVNLWSQVSEVGSNSWTINETNTSYNRTPRTGSFNVTLKYSNTDWLIRPVELTAGQAYDFELYARQDGATATNSDVGLYYGTEATSAAMVSITGQVGIVNGDYQLISGTFTPETSGIYYLGIKGFMNGSPWYISIDDITIKESEAVADPEIPTAVSISADGASITLSWEAAANANSYNIYACDTPDGDYDEENPIASVSGLTHTFTASETMKFFKVKASSDVVETPAKGLRRQ